MIIIGLGYEKGVGKDTVAQMIMSHFTAAHIPALRRAFADALKEECAQMVAEYFNLDASIVLAEMHSDDPGVKQRWRLLMQWWGSEGWRHEDRDHWIKVLRLWIEVKETANKALADKTFLFIPDVRFQNEAEFIKRNGGLLIRVERPGCGGQDSHASENDLVNYTGWDARISNDDSWSVLERKAYEMYTWLRSWAKCDV